MLFANIFSHHHTRQRRDCIPPGSIPKLSNTGCNYLEPNYVQKALRSPGVCSPGAHTTKFTATTPSSKWQCPALPTPGKWRPHNNTAHSRARVAIGRREQVRQNDTSVWKVSRYTDRRLVARGVRRSRCCNKNK